MATTTMAQKSQRMIVTDGFAQQDNLHFSNAGSVGASLLFANKISDLRDDL